MTTPANSPWTPERTAKLRAMWADGFSTPYIAKLLGGGISHNSVIGKAHRLGLGDHANTRNRAAVTRNYRRRTRRQKLSLAPTTPEANSVAPEPLVTFVEPEPVEAQIDTRVTFDHLRFPISQCRWIDGDPSSDHTLYCGARTEIGKSYCAEHHARVWVPRQRRAA